MIIEVIFGFFMEVLKKALDLIAFIELPIDMITILVPVLAYGNAIVGLDLIGVILGSLVFWIAVKSSVGLALFIYHNIPFV